MLTNVCNAYLGAFNKGRSRSIPRNDSIRRITTSLVPFNLTIKPTYVSSSDNRADPVSRGILGSPAKHLRVSFQLPEELAPFLSYV
jgi:hypothetical protein